MRRIWKPPPLLFVKSHFLLFILLFILAFNTNIIDCFGIPNRFGSSLTQEETTDDLGVLDFLFGNKGIIPKLIRDPPQGPLTPFTRPLVQWSHDAPAPLDAPLIQGVIGNPEESDFWTKLLEKLRRKKYGAPPEKFDFPSMGLCTKATCAGLYAALEKLRKSPMLTNFNTMLSLAQDKDGLKTIAEVITDKDLISTFTGPGPKPKPRPADVARPKPVLLSPQDWASEMSSKVASGSDATDDYYAMQDSAPSVSDPLDFEDSIDDQDFHELEPDVPTQVAGPSTWEDRRKIQNSRISSRAHAVTNSREVSANSPVFPPPPPPSFPRRDLPIIRASVSKLLPNIPDDSSDLSQGMTIRKPEPIERIPQPSRSREEDTHSRHPAPPTLHDTIIVSSNPFAEQPAAVKKVEIAESNDAPRQVFSPRQRFADPQTVRRVRPSTGSLVKPRISSVDIKPMQQRTASTVRSRNLNYRRNLLLLNRRTSAGVTSPRRSQWRAASSVTRPLLNNPLPPSPLVRTLTQPQPNRGSLQQARPPAPAPIVKPRDHNDYYDFYDDN